MKQCRIPHPLLLLGLLLLFSSCRSIDEIVIGRISEIMSSDTGAGAFVRDNDPQFVADALPFALKVYEMLIDMNPEDPALRLAAGRGFIMYANAFIQTPASMLPDEEWEQQEVLLRRARNMYLRGRDYVLSGLALKIDSLDFLLENDPDGLLTLVEQEDAPYLYWASAGWLGAFSANPFDIELGIRISLPVALLYRVLELDESLERGGVHDLLITIWSSLPRGIIEKSFIDTPATAGAFAARYYDALGVEGDEESRARHHFQRSLELSRGLSPSPYLTFAAGFPVMQQDYEEFETLLNLALAIDPRDDPDNELTIVVLQEKAAWYLEHREDFFLLDF